MAIKGGYSATFDCGDFPFSNNIGQTVRPGRVEEKLGTMVKGAETAKNNR